MSKPRNDVKLGDLSLLLHSSKQTLGKRGSFINDCMRRDVHPKWIQCVNLLGLQFVCISGVELGE